MGRVMINIISLRPHLTKSLDSETFKSFYWEKKELLAFCVENKIPAQGTKLELSDRVEYFLNTGAIQPVRDKIKGAWSRASAKAITLETPVINYKSDLVTKEFFVAQLGAKFKFNNYLRQFAKTPNMDGSLTYGDLAQGYLSFEANKKSAPQKALIAKQFQFNQFQRDFYACEKGKTRQQFLDAWKLVRSIAGPATYDQYLSIINIGCKSEQE